MRVRSISSGCRNAHAPREEGGEGRHAWYLNTAMLSFRTFLAELTNRPYAYTWTSTSRSYWVASFVTDATTAQQTPLPYAVVFQAIPVRSAVPDAFLDAMRVAGATDAQQAVFRATDRLWQLTFELREHPGTVSSQAHLDPWGIHATGGQQIRIFSTLLAVLRDFTERVRPGVVVFSAKEASRVKLYRRFVQQTNTYLPQYAGTGPYPETTADKWMVDHIGADQFFLLVRKRV